MRYIVVVALSAIAIAVPATAQASPAPCSKLNGVIICAGNGIPPGAVGPLTAVLQEAGIGYQGDPDALAPISQALKDAGIGVETAP